MNLSATMKRAMANAEVLARLNVVQSIRHGETQATQWTGWNDLRRAIHSSSCWRGGESRFDAMGRDARIEALLRRGSVIDSVDHTAGNQAPIRADSPGRAWP